MERRLLKCIFRKYIFLRTSNYFFKYFFISYGLGHIGNFLLSIFMLFYVLLNNLLQNSVEYKRQSLPKNFFSLCQLSITSYIDITIEKYE